ncbi:MAG: ThuA domain-containing protein [Chloroflexi bacterium]|nr:ThuA domain-containing protein [Chloroflexota bacterium]
MNARRILIILGGIYHDFEGFAGAMRRVLEKAGHTVEATYDLDTLLTLDQGLYDVVLSYTSFSRHREGRDDTHPETLSPAQTDSLVRWVRSGGALLGVHSATVSGAPNPALTALWGGLFVEHPPQFSFMVYPMRHRHPITADVDAFAVKDEFYIQDYDPAVNVHMVALDRGVAHPMVWTRMEGEGRVAYIAPGHHEGIWNLEPFQRLVLQAIDWLTE